MNEMPGVERVTPATVHSAVLSVCGKMGIDPQKPMSAAEHAQFSAEFEQAIYATAELHAIAAGPATFEFDGTPEPWRGVPVVNGHKILTAQSVAVDIPGDGLPVVTLRLVAADALKVVLGDAKAYVHDETRIALISMGWTPPDD